MARPTNSAPHEQMRSVLESMQTDRREFLRYGILGGAAIAAGWSAAEAAGWQERPGEAPEQPLASAPLERVRVGFVGVGGMGTHHVNLLCRIPGAAVVAVCDLVPERVQRAQDIVEKAGQPRPAGFDRGPQDYRRLCETVECDLVFTATPWELHVPVCLAAMHAGKHAATEVPAAVTVEECWQLVETAEKLRRHCVMMENCCYDRTELLFLNMVRKGLIGDVLHAECGYLHDLREVKHDAGGEGAWRRAHSVRRNGNLYPTHGIGPIANYMNLNRGDRMDYLVSMSGPSRGLQLWQAAHLAEDDPRREKSFALGDVNATLIQTAAGRTIYLVHDTNLPRPYSRINMVQGTKGILKDYPPQVHIEGRSQGHGWEPAEKYRQEFEHPLWKSDIVKRASGGHGGMDYLEDYRLVQCLREGRPTDQNVYDAASWSALCELTERSVASRSRPVDVPDFTRGRWKTWEPWPIVEA